jgi:putative phosphoribosyl transferase
MEDDGFVDRTAAGRALAGAVKNLKLRRPMLVLALPRGGVPVAYEVALALRAPSMFSWCARSGCPVSRSLRSVRLPRAASIVRDPGSTGHLRALDTHFERLAKRELRELDRRERAQACRRSTCVARPWCSSMTGSPQGRQ